MNLTDPRQTAGADDEYLELAPLYAAGALDAASAVAVDEHHRTGCAACEVELRAVSETIADLAFALPPRRPSASCRARLMDRIAPPQVDSYNISVRGEQIEWRCSGFPGVMMKQLFVDRATGNVTSLVKVGPGAVYPAHRHAGPEQCYVIEGDMVFNDHALRAGDYEVAMASTSHSVVTSVHGCMILLVSNLHDEILL